MDNKELQRLAQNYLDGTATIEEKALLDQWYDTIHHDGQVETVWVSAHETEADVKQQMLTNILEKIKREKANERKVKLKNGGVKKLIISACSAAAAILIVTVAVRYFSQAVPKIQTNRTQLICVNAKKVMKITLSDGSAVWLNANTVFKYPNSFTGRVRGVELVEGRAFFDVKHQNTHPFMVKTKDMNITVLGTSFDVRSYGREGSTKVSVLTGKVGITRPGHPDEPAVMLLPKQQVVLSKSTSQLTKAAAQEPVVNLWCKSPLVFEQENLNNVFKAIEKQYNTHVETSDQKLLNERISITLGNQRLDTIMEILSFTKHFKYEIANDSTVLIKQ